MQPFGTAIAASKKVHTFEIVQDSDSDEPTDDAFASSVKQYLDGAILKVERSISEVLRENMAADHAFVPDKAGLHDEAVLENRGNPSMSPSSRVALLLPTQYLDEPVEKHPLGELPISSDVHIN